MRPITARPLKRVRSTENTSPPSKYTKVHRRKTARPVTRDVLTFWDKHKQSTDVDLSIIRKKFLHAAKRSQWLRKTRLLYDYAEIRPDQIRLLFIKPAAAVGDPVYVEMKTFNDSEVGPSEDGQLQGYEALSYHWGPGPAEYPIYMSGKKYLPQVGLGDLADLKTMIPDCDMGKRFYVRPNLDKALRHLRDKEHEVVMWVDAVCINQKDEKGEKPMQIAKMKDIYNRATNVCIWLGTGEGGEEGRREDFQAALDFSQEITDLGELERRIKDREATKRWSDLLDVMRCSWFSRRWVIQELALAREATVHCGDKSVPWQEFADAIGLFSLNFDRIRALFRQSNDDKIFRNYRSFNELEPLGAKVLVDAITNAFRRSVDDTIFEPISDLETLVSNLSSFESSDPRDTIFALLNIARESQITDRRSGEVGPPMPDYGRDLLEVYTDFLEWVVHSSGSLDILCRHWAIPERQRPGGRKSTTPLVALPTWIQTVTESTWGLQEQGFNGRINGDSIVGRAGRRRYNASYGRKPEVRFGKRNSSSPPQVNGSTPSPNSEAQPRELHVRGMIIGEVTWVSGIVSKGVITKECLEKGGWTNSDHGLTKVPDKLWRTLVADRTIDGENLRPWYHRAALHCMTQVDSNGHIGIRELLNDGIGVEGTLPQIVFEYLKRVEGVIWNRHFIEGSPTGSNVEPLFGLSPPGSQQGDLICILYGCSVPVILRPGKISEVNGMQNHSFVGEAYIYGRMDGEVINMLDEKSLLEKTIEFIIV